MEFIDTHCHLHFDSYEANREEVYRSALKAGVTRMICVGTTLADSRAAIKYAQSKSGAWASAGTHPHDAQSVVDLQSSALEIKELIKESKVVAIGEIGLDFYKNYSPKLTQEKALRLQIEAGLDSGLPFIFHIREAWADFWRIFDEYKNLSGVVHSFSAHPRQLEEVLDRGLYIGLNGIMTFTKDSQQLQAAKLVPADRLLLETDAPFLTPQPFRGQVCEPKHIKPIAEFLAELRGQSVKELSASTTENAVRLFNLK